MLVLSPHPLLVDGSFEAIFLFTVPFFAVSRRTGRSIHETHHTHTHTQAEIFGVGVGSVWMVKVRELLSKLTPQNKVSAKSK